MVRARVALGLSVSAVFLLLAWLDSRLAGGPIFHVLIGAIMVGALLEVYGLAQRRQAEPLKLAPIVVVVGLVAWDYAGQAGSLALGGVPVARGGAALSSFYAVTGLGAAVGFWALALAHLLTRDPRHWLAGAPATIFGFLYVWFIGAHIFPIRGMGMGYVLALLAASKLGDSGAFFVGRHWGRRRLAPRTSPNKTVEGAAGGLLASVVSTLAVAAILRLEGSVGFWALFGLVVGAASQLGDLVASALKRSAGAKDSGQLVPHLGGLLDIVDSPLMAAPVAFWLLAM